MDDLKMERLLEGVVGRVFDLRFAEINRGFEERIKGLRSEMDLLIDYRGFGSEKTAEEGRRILGSAAEDGGRVLGSSAEGMNSKAELTNTAVALMNTTALDMARSTSIEVDRGTASSRLADVASRATSFHSSAAAIVHGSDDQSPTPYDKSFHLSEKTEIRAGARWAEQGDWILTKLMGPKMGRIHCSPPLQIRILITH